MNEHLYLNASKCSWFSPHLVHFVILNREKSVFLLLLAGNSSPRSRLEKLDFNPGEMNYVGLVTPPRTLTMEEAFSQQAIEEETEQAKHRPAYSNLPNG